MAETCAKRAADTEEASFDESNSKRRKKSNGKTNGSHQGPKLRECAKCHSSKDPSAFSPRQRKKGAEAKCRSCIEGENPSTGSTQQNKPSGRPLLQCHGCFNLKHRTKSFSAEELAKGSAAQCHGCVKIAQGLEKLKVLKQCSRCCNQFKLADFPKSEREKQEGPLCNGCWHKTQIPTKRCNGCYAYLKLNRFSSYQKSKCLDCEWEPIDDRHIVSRIIEGLEPRECQVCHQFMGSSGFSFYRWMDTPVSAKISCLECLSPEEEEQQQRDANWKLAKQMAIAYGIKFGAMNYKYPNAIHFKSTFGSEPPESLEGTYQIIFCTGWISKNRTNPGTFTLEKVEDNDGTPSYLGRVEFRSQQGATALHGNNYAISNTSMNARDRVKVSRRRKYPWKMKFVLDPDSSNKFGDFEVVTSKLWVISKRLALPWIPTVKGSKELSFDYDKQVKFDSLEEAEKLHRWHQNRYSNSWIVNHLPPLTPDIAQHILEYVTVWSPPPVLFFEPGDLLLRTRWDETTDLILRKVGPHGCSRMEEPLATVSAQQMADRLWEQVPHRWGDYGTGT
ncbi:expressed unknown protein [Seminavis robusta]|uniref:Uncharacterized protein n=1 Tax=Seminavis robusta TaxID=568900 RepID=A0A9N8EAU0_9STRA|nr:expressed unknown protein [Seminavis robusta]|eukprot:Sro819_g207100.1 n/a (560) ;mRNA; r:22156-23904